MLQCSRTCFISFMLCKRIIRSRNLHQIPRSRLWLFIHLPGEKGQDTESSWNWNNVPLWSLIWSEGSSYCLIAIKRPLCSISSEFHNCVTHFPIGTVKLQLPCVECGAAFHLARIFSSSKSFLSNPRSSLFWAWSFLTRESNFLVGAILAKLVSIRVKMIPHGDSDPHRPAFWIKAHLLSLLSSLLNMSSAVATAVATPY